MTHTAALPMGLADQLKTRTETLHREAERSGIIQDLLRGRAGRPAYALLLRNLLPVYEAIERRLDSAETASALGAFAWPELYRAAALRSDLDRIAGPDWPETLPILASGRHYGERVSDSASGDGLMLVAHIYVRYLGDLNGGQILRRMMMRHLRLGADALAFYDFPDLSDPRRSAAVYRALFDEVDMPIDAVEPFLVEATTAFRLNIDLSREVARVAAKSEPCPIEAEEVHGPESDACRSDQGRTTASEPGPAIANICECVGLGKTSMVVYRKQ